MKTHDVCWSLVSLALLQAVGTGLRAETIVAWNGDYVSADQRLVAGGWNAADNQFDPISPAAGTYSGPVVAGRISGSNPNMIVKNVSTQDQIQIKQMTWGLALFQKEGFLGGGNAYGVTLDQDSRVTLYVNTNANRLEYLVLRKGDSFYRSAEVVTGSTAGTFTFAPTELTWFAYDPVTNPADLSGGAASPIEAGVISGVQAVGLLSVLGSGTDAFRCDRVEVTATVASPSTGSVILLR